MLRPIPARILRSTAAVKVCTAVDMYQRQTYGEEYSVERVHIQPTERIVKTKDNTDKTLSAVLFADVRRSGPDLNWALLLEQAHDRGGDVRVIVRDFEYTAVTAELLRDDTDRPHHWEIGLV